MPSICKPSNSDKEIFVNYPYDILEQIKDEHKKRITKEFITILNKQIAEHISKGDWTSIPFIGNVRASLIKQELNTDTRKQQLSDAKSVLTAEEYKKFKVELIKDIDRDIRAQRTYKYLVSMRVKSYKKYYKRMVEERGARVANFALYCKDKMTVVSNIICYENRD